MSSSSSTMRKCGLMLALLAPLAGLGGCADYLNHRDTITLAAGNAVAVNRAIHTIDPQARRAEDTTIQTDGKYVSNVMDIYHSRPVPVAAEGAGAAAAPVAVAE